MSKEEYVLIYIISNKNSNILLLKKNHGPKIILEKLNGFGGKIKEIDIKNNKIHTIIQAAKRELKEELEIPLKINLFSQTQKFEIRGKIKIDNKIIHILTTKINFDKIQETTIPKKGTIHIKPINYFLTNPDEFPKQDLQFLKELFFTNNYFEKNLKIY